jgi:NAD(P)-dependent dehydrogenase (short-subunit alcohol dehydrogenase family)
VSGYTHRPACRGVAPPSPRPDAAGIGRATTLALCDRGWRVFAGVLTEGEAQEMRGLHAGIEPVLLDVTE